MYTEIDKIIHSLCTNLSCQKPAIAISFQAPNTYQAMVVFLINGTFQIHIGADLIRTFLLNTSPENTKPMYKAFKWVIAHEIGHLNTEAFQLYAKTYGLRKIINISAYFILIASILSFLFPKYILIINHEASFTIIKTILAFIATKTIAFMFFNRKLEYMADKKSIISKENITTQDAILALTTMKNSIQQWLNNGAGSLITKTLIRIKTFLSYPQVSKRINRFLK